MIEKISYANSRNKIISLNHRVCSVRFRQMESPDKPRIKFRPDFVPRLIHTVHSRSINGTVQYIRTQPSLGHVSCVCVRAAILITGARRTSLLTGELGPLHWCA